MRVRGWDGEGEGSGWYGGGRGAMGWVCEARARSVVMRPEATRFALIRAGEQSAEIPRREAKSAHSGVARPAVRLVLGARVDVTGLWYSAPLCTHFCLSGVSRAS